MKSSAAMKPVVEEHAENSLPPLLPLSAALFLDFDGTLVEIAQRPNLIVVPEETRELLCALSQRQKGALAILTGRALSAVDEFLKPLLLAGAGLHGAELRSGGETAAALDARCTSALLLAKRLRDYFQADPRVLVENKIAAVALHYRQAPEQRTACEEAMNTLGADFTADLEVIHGNMVIEARLRGADKGKALHSLLEKPPFLGRRPVVVGDDRTDEDAFAAAQQLNGITVKVGGGATCATYRLSGVAAVRNWLQQSLASRHD